MPEIDVRGLKKLSASFEKVLKDSPEIQREYHQQMGGRLEWLIRGRIPNRTGKVRNWQNAHFGTGGGYVAIRPDDAPKGENGPHAVTWYLEAGHKKRKNKLESVKQTTKQAKLRAVAGDNWVPGKWFYDSSEGVAASLLELTARQFAAEIADRLR